MAVKKVVKSGATKTVSKSSSKKSSKCGCGPFSDAQLDMIRECAYYIWERKGRPEGTQESNFQEAVQELKDKGLL